MCWILTIIFLWWTLMLRWTLMLWKGEPVILLIIGYSKSQSMLIFYKMSRKDHLSYGILSVKPTADLIINHLKWFKIVFIKIIFIFNVIMNINILIYKYVISILNLNGFVTVHVPPMLSLSNRFAVRGTKTSREPRIGIKADLTVRVYRFNKDSEKRTSVFDSKSGQSNRLGEWMGFFSFLVLGLANIIFKETNQYIWFIPPPTKHLLQKYISSDKKSLIAFAQSLR